VITTNLGSKHIVNKEGKITNGGSVRKKKGREESVNRIWKKEEDCNGDRQLPGEKHGFRASVRGRRRKKPLRGATLRKTTARKQLLSFTAINNRKKEESVLC